MYKLFKSALTNSQVIVRLSDGISIPFEEANTDYQEYLKWLSEGNTPLPVEEQ